MWAHCGTWQSLCARLPPLLPHPLPHKAAVVATVPRYHRCLPQVPRSMPTQNLWELHKCTAAGRPCRTRLPPPTPPTPRRMHACRDLPDDVEVVFAGHSLGGALGKLMWCLTLLHKYR